MKLSKNAQNAFMLGTLCSIAYFAVYIARNILSAVTPAMVELGYTESYIGSISSLFFVFYAVGQLINGAIGDKINSKWMICLGLGLAGISNFIFPFVTTNKLTATLVYSITGFFLSMIYGPMTKVVSENTEPLHAVRCSIGYTFSSLFGSPMAGILAACFAWNTAFNVSSIALVAMAITSFLIFTMFEKRGIIKYNQFEQEKHGKFNFKILLKHEIVKYSFVSILTGIVRTSVVFWLPTYIAQYLGFSSEKAAGIFTVSTFVISFTAVIAIFIYEKLGHNANLSLFLMFAASLVSFVITYLVKASIPNIIFMILAIMSANAASSILWSVYCPSLRDTGMVSSATGFLDFLSYMAAAAANLIFANALEPLGWKNLILVWCGLSVIGVAISIPFKKKRFQN